MWYISTKCAVKETTSTVGYLRLPSHDCKLHFGAESQHLKEDKCSPHPHFGGQLMQPCLTPVLQQCVGVPYLLA